jgi:carotenoid cleavage dioxygenase
METFDAPYSCMAHDFLATANYLVFPILPLAGSLKRAMSGQRAFAWEPDNGAYVGVVRRDASAASMRWFRCDPCYVYHGMNAYEDEDTIVAHVMQYEAPPFFPELNAESTDPAKTIARLYRWEFNLKSDSDKVKQEQVDDLSGDFPRLDERFALHPYRHGYFAATAKRCDVTRFDMIAHYDFVTGRRATFGISEGDAFSEPVFVPKNTESAEGDGYLLATIYRGSERRSDLAIFEAGAIEKGPIALAELSHRVTLGFHGAWLDETAAAIRRADKPN